MPPPSQSVVRGGAKTDMGTPGRGMHWNPPYYTNGVNSFEIKNLLAWTGINHHIGACRRGTGRGGEEHGPAALVGPPTATRSTSADTVPTRTVVPYAHNPAWAGDSAFLPKSGRRLPGGGWHWHGGEGQVAWGQQLELLLGLDLEEHCSHPVHGHLQPLKGLSLPPVGASLVRFAAGQGGGHASAAQRGPGRGPPPAWPSSWLLRPAPSVLMPHLLYSAPGVLRCYLMGTDTMFHCVINIHSL